MQVALAEVLAKLSQSSEAIRNALEAEDAGRAHLRLTLRYLPERQALGYGKQMSRGLDVALSVSDKDAEATALVLDDVIRRRALILDEWPDASTVPPTRLIQRWRRCR